MVGLILIFAQNVFKSNTPMSLKKLYSSHDRMNQFALVEVCVISALQICYLFDSRTQ